MQIPAAAGWERSWFEQVVAPQVFERTVHARQMLFIVEPTRTPCQHACSIDDVCETLGLLPEQDLVGIGAILFRQATRKQRMLSPTWGRMIFSAEIGQPGRSNVYSGPAIVLEAQDWTRPLAWSRSLGPEDVREVERLRQDGHIVTETERQLLFCGTQAATRNTQLFRTLPHEVGHWVDWLERVERPWEISPGADYGHLTDTYWSRPASERESFAHRYAERHRGVLALIGDQTGNP